MRYRYLAPGIQQRRRKLYAVQEIPRGLRAKFGRARFVQSLETDSLVVAKRRAGPIIAGWQREIAQAKGEPDDAAFWRRSLKKATSEEQRKLILEEIADEAWEIGAIDVPEIGMSPSSSPKAQDFFARATDTSIPFTEHLDDYLAQLHVAAPVADQRRSEAQEFGRTCPKVSDVTHEAVQRWASGLTLTPGTVRRILSGLRGYWRYMQRSDVSAAPRDVLPFDKIDLPRREKRRRKPFKPVDVVKLLNAAADDSKLADLIRLVMWTGCRIEELCSLKTASVHDDHFTVQDAKTAAGVRDVPIHPELKQTIARLLDEATDGYLLPGLTSDKYGRRHGGLGKRFTKLKTAQGFGPAHVFHSIRKTVATLLEDAGVLENVAADILGHEKPRITYGLYSGGAGMAAKAEALAKVAYPKG